MLVYNYGKCYLSTVNYLSIQMHIWTSTDEYILPEWVVIIRKNACANVCTYGLKLEPAQGGAHSHANQTSIQDNETIIASKSND